MQISSIYRILVPEIRKIKQNVSLTKKINEHEKIITLCCYPK
ncbi:hypothetical protein HMPREF1322_0300 [Porphyromonas gingivalis W50]|nr:hypothetical protein HMPREF1322_0300 [Porphyromonas gingivalis W50]EOA09813.1 hypothetical protein A343_1530 [Porphyromonas gingivalis JCVI SC001]